MITQDYFRIYNDDFGFQYLGVLHVIVLNCLGSDFYPVNLAQTVIAGLGLVVGAFINANIFGELSLIFSELGKSNKLFQRKTAEMNTAMINLGLPFELCQ